MQQREQRYRDNNSQTIKNRNRKRSHRRKKRKRLQRTGWILCIVMIGLIINGFGGPAELIENAFQKYSMEELTEKGYPKSLAQLYMRNSEAKEFVLGYKKYDGNAEDIDISGEIHKGKIPVFLQWDSRWGYETYGDDFMALTGCGPTSLSMVYSGLTGDASLHPLKMARLAEEKGYYVNGSGSSWNMMTGLAEVIGLTVWKPSFTEEAIKAELEEGHPIICIMGPGDFTTTGHFIVLAGVMEDKIIVNDPNSPKNSEKLWDIEKIMKQTRDLWAYDCRN